MHQAPPESQEHPQLLPTIFCQPLGREVRLAAAKCAWPAPNTYLQGGSREGGRGAVGEEGGFRV